MDPKRLAVIAPAKAASKRLNVAHHYREEILASTQPGATRPANAPSVSYPPTVGDWKRSLRPNTLSTARFLKFPVTQAQAGHAPPARGPGTAPGRPTGTAWCELLAGLLPWREQRFARCVSRELLELYRTVSGRHARLRGRDLYRQIVIAHKQADPDSADALLDQAEKSYASWPTPRTLTFCDVVHFIAVSEFLASHADTPWIQADMRREVQSLIPRNL